MPRHSACFLVAGSGHSSLLLQGCRRGAAESFLPSRLGRLWCDIVICYLWASPDLPLPLSSVWQQRIRLWIWHINPQALEVVESLPLGPYSDNSLCYDITRGSGHSRKSEIHSFSIARLRFPQRILYQSSIQQRWLSLRLLHQTRVTKARALRLNLSPGAGYTRNSENRKEARRGLRRGTGRLKGSYCLLSLQSFLP